KMCRSGGVKLIHEVGQVGLSQLVRVVGQVALSQLIRALDQVDPSRQRYLTLAPAVPGPKRAHLRGGAMARRQRRVPHRRSRPVVPEAPDPRTRSTGPSL